MSSFRSLFCALPRLSPQLRVIITIIITITTTSRELGKRTPTARALPALSRKRPCARFGVYAALCSPHDSYDRHRGVPLPAVLGAALGQLSLIAGANGSGKSSVYRALRLLADVAQNAALASLAREGGLPSTLWAGPETISRSVRQGTHAVQPLARSKPESLKLAFGSDAYGYSIDLGYPLPSRTLFALDPHIKRECLWHGPVYRKAAALVERRNNFVWLSTLQDREPVMLTQHLPDTDSMLASVADPQRAPEMLAVRRRCAAGASMTSSAAPDGSALRRGGVHTLASAEGVWRDGAGGCHRLEPDEVALASALKAMAA